MTSSPLFCIVPRCGPCQYCTMPIIFNGGNGKTARGSDVIRAIWPRRRNRMHQRQLFRLGPGASDDLGPTQAFLAHQQRQLCRRAADRIESYGRKGRKQFLRRSRGSMAGVIASGLVFVGGASARAVSNLAFRVKRYLINNSGYSGYPLAEYSAVIWKYTHGMLRSVRANRKRHPGCIRMSYIES